MIEHLSFESLFEHFAYFMENIKEAFVNWTSICVKKYGNQYGTGRSSIGKMLLTIVGANCQKYTNCKYLVLRVTVSSIGRHQSIVLGCFLFAFQTVVACPHSNDKWIRLRMDSLTRDFFSCILNNTFIKQIHIGFTWIWMKR